MKAVVLEIHGNYVAALTDDGSVIKFKNQNYSVGQVIQENAGKKPHMRFIARAACAAAVIALTSISAWAYYTPVSYVSLDVNPSIEYTLNRFDCVLSCTAINGDGEKIVEHLKLKNKNIEDAIHMTVLEIAAEGYLTQGDTGDIIVTASNSDQKKSDELAKSLETVAKEAVTKSQVKAQIEAESVSKAQVQEAKAMGTTPGKLVLIRKLQESSSTEANINVQEWANKPVKEIMQEIKENKQSAKASVNNNNKESKTDTKQEETSKQSNSSNSLTSSSRSNNTNNSKSANSSGSPGSLTNSNQNNKDISTAAPAGNSETGKKQAAASQNGKEKNSSSNAKVKNK